MRRSLLIACAAAGSAICAAGSTRRLTTVSCGTVSVGTTGEGNGENRPRSKTRRMNDGDAAFDEKVGGSGKNGNGREGNRKTSRDSEGKMTAQPIENAPRRASQARPEICRPRPHANGTRPRRAPFLHRARAATVLSSWNCGVDRASHVMFYAGDRLVLQIPEKSTVFQGLIPKESPRVPSSGSSVSSSSMSRPSL